MDLFLLSFAGITLLVDAYAYSAYQRLQYFKQRVKPAGSHEEAVRQRDASLPGIAEEIREAGDTAENFQDAEERIQQFAAPPAPSQRPSDVLVAPAEDVSPELVNAIESAISPAATGRAFQGQQESEEDVFKEFAVAKDFAVAKEFESPVSHQELSQKILDIATSHDLFAKDLEIIKAQFSLLEKSPDAKARKARATVSTRKQRKDLGVVKARLSVLEKSLGVKAKKARARAAGIREKASTRKQRKDLGLVKARVSVLEESGLKAKNARVRAAGVRARASSRKQRK